VLCIAVIGGTSRAPLAKAKLEAAAKTGQLLATTPVHVLTSGIRHGMVGRVLDALQSSANPRSAFVVEGSGEEEHLHPAAGTLNLFPSISHRKSAMLERAHQVIALPGGLGTHDELITFLIQRKSFGGNSIVLINVDNYFDPFVTLLEAMVSEGFLKPKHLLALQLMPSAEAAVEAVTSRLT
jgi:uncharacterized protein (TIGR00730 family)